MKNLSSKKWYFYISLCLLFLFSAFVVIAYGTKMLDVFCSKEVCSTYYLFTYLLVVAVMYWIDVQTRKEPAFLTIFALPAYTFIYLFLCILCSGMNYAALIVLCLVIVLVYVLCYIVNKYWIEKIMNIKNGYHNITFIYIMVHLLIVVYVSFKIFSFL